MPQFLKRLPKSEDHGFPRPGVWYRHPLYKDSHILVTHDSDTALCGRGLVVDEMWWVDTVWENEAGPLYLRVDTRKHGKCSACRRRLKELEADGRYKPPPKRGPWDEEGRELLTARQRVADLRTRALASWVAREFGGSVE